MNYNINRFRKEPLESPYNSKMFNFYINSIEDNEQIVVSTKYRYLDEVLKFLRYYKTDVNQITLENIKRYLDTRKADSSKVLTRNSLISFFTYVSLNTALNFHIENIPVISNIKKNNPAQPLSIDEIINLRNSLLKENEYQLKFTLEMVYTYDCSLDELVNCNSENYNDGCFNLQGHKFIIQSDFKLLIEDNYSMIFDQKKNRNKYQRQFNRMGRYLDIERNIEYKDIKKSREIHSMKCPVCHKSYLCESGFWCLAIHNHEPKITRLICKNCALNMEANENE